MSEQNQIEALLAFVALDPGAGGIVAALVDVFDIGQLSADDRRYLGGPVVVHQSGWTDTLPEWMPPAVRAERVKIVLGRSPWPIVGPAEIACCMYPATMEAPLRHEFAELYFWATCHAASAHYDKDPAEYWTRLNMRPIEDDDVVQSGGRLWHVYSELARDIRHKVIAQAPKLGPQVQDDEKPTDQAAAAGQGGPARAIQLIRRRRMTTGHEAETIACPQCRCLPLARCKRREHGDPHIMRIAAWHYKQFEQARLAGATPPSDEAS